MWYQLALAADALNLDEIAGAKIPNPRVVQRPHRCRRSWFVNGCLDRAPLSLIPPPLKSISAAMVPDAWVYRAADRLIRQHGAGALEEVNRRICDALDHREHDRAVLMVRIRLAILVLQAPPQGPLH
jgi:hypothetical protein